METFVLRFLLEHYPINKIQSTIKRRVEILLKIFKFTPEEFVRLISYGD